MIRKNKIPIVDGQAPTKDVSLAITAVVPISNQSVVDWFHQLHHTKAWYTTWLGFQIMKNPFDMWMYQQIIVENKPDFIVETGTLLGGSALYMASLCDLLDNGKVITIDDLSYVEEGITREEYVASLPQHKRITYLRGNSVSASIIRQIKDCIGHNQKVMVVLDSDHSKEHVLKELQLYSQLVTTGQYLIVEDTNVNGHPIDASHGPGPWEAVQEWIPEHSDFKIDKGCERYLVTWNPDGYLRKIK